MFVLLKYFIILNYLIALLFDKINLWKDCVNYVKVIYGGREEKNV